MKYSDKSGFDGNVEGLSLLDLVQLACLEGYDRKLVVQSEHSNGAIYFADSEIVHAEFDDLITGEEAFYRIMRLQAGAFSMTFSSTDKRTIDSSWNFLLMEAVRLIDEEDISQEKEDSLLKVLVVDDSRLFTKSFVKLFEEKIDAKVVGTATNGKEALKFLEKQVPDLVTLDINMPVMGGDVTLKHIMIRSPAPVVLVSSFNEQTCSKLIDFMRFGAVDVMAKPVDPQSGEILRKRMQYILTNVKEFHVNNVSRAKNLRPVEIKSKPDKRATKLLLVLSGLGGLLELQKIIPALEYNSDTAVLVLQNMYPSLAEHFAAYLNNFSAYTTTPLYSNMELWGGQCQIGNWHGKWEVLSEGGKPVISGSQDDNNAVSLDSNQLFISAADMFGSALSVVILSGIYMDLGKGLEYISNKGGRVVMQNPESCLLPGSIGSLNTSSATEYSSLKPEEIASFLSKNI